MTTAPQTPASTLTAISAGQEMVGSSLSVTLISKVHTAVKPAASVTVYSRVVVPTGNASSELSPVRSV